MRQLQGGVVHLPGFSAGEIFLSVFANTLLLAALARSNSICANSQNSGFVLKYFAKRTAIDVVILLLSRLMSLNAVWLHSISFDTLLQLRLYLSIKSSNSEPGVCFAFDIIYSLLQV
jgi:hypothetical protein